MKIEVWSHTDKGLRRESNQDSYLVNTELNLFVVADGMGGHSGGEVASSMAVETVEEVMLSKELQNMAPRDAVQFAYEEASRRIYDKAALTNPELAGMGTTMVAAYIKDNIIYIGNVGDSRCYLFKKPYLWQLTEDHSLVNEQLRSGFMTEEQVLSLVGRNVITRSVGYEKEVQPDTIERQLSPGEIFILCSDGLSGLVSDEKMSEIINQNAPDKIARLCLEQALKNGGDDNVTVLALHIRE